MKKLAIASAFLLLFAAAVFWAGPATVEARLNRTRQPVTPVATRAGELHRTLLIADLHADTLLWGRDLLSENTRGQVDVPRLIRGNVAVQAFTVVTKAPRGINMVRNPDSTDLVLPLALLERWPPATWRSMKQRALYQAGRFHDAVAASGGRLISLQTAADLRTYLALRGHTPNVTAGFLGVEGAHALDGDVANLQELFDAGFRMMSPTHFTDNAFGGSSTGVDKGGLTEKGRQLIREMEKRRMIVDLAHTSPQTIDDVLSIATRPVVVSHTGVQGTCKSARNLRDAQIRRIAQSGGLIGIAYFEAATCGKDAKAIVRAIRYTSRIAGVEHVALGSDFDGGVTMPFDSGELAVITEALLQDGFAEADIAKIMGGNTLRFLAENLP